MEGKKIARRGRKSTYRSRNQNVVQRKSTHNHDDLSLYAKVGIDSRGGLRGSNTVISSYTVEQIKSFLDNPASQYIQIGSLMEALARRNGIVNRTLSYYTSLPTYNFNIYPNLTSKNNYSLPSDISEYLAAAEYVDRYNIKFFAPYFVSQTLINGMSFFYEVSTSHGVGYLEFPISMGKIIGIDNGVYRWMIDTSRLREEIVGLEGFPNEIKKAFEATDKTDPKKWVDGKYYKLSDKAFALTFDMSVIKNGGVAISEFASLLVDSVQVEKAKNNVDIKDDIDTVRILHGKIPMDNEGNVKMAPKAVGIWRDVLDQSLPPGIQGIVTPFELSNVTLNGSGSSKAYDTVEDSQSQLFYTTGTSSQMFGGNTNSYNIANMGTIKDWGWIFTKVIPALGNYYNGVLSKMKSSSGVTWKIRFIEQTIFTTDEVIKRLKDAISFGGSRTDYLASLGMTPMEIYSKLYMEQHVINIDELMIPKPTSFTMSASNGEGEIGRPKTDTPSDDTDRIEN